MVFYVKTFKSFLMMILVSGIFSGCSFIVNRYNDVCITRIEEKIVRGDSMFGLIRSGEKVKVLYGYYNCNDIKRGDIVLVNYAGSENYLVKVVKGIPGDSFKLVKNNGWWNILINNKVVKNSRGDRYIVFTDGYRLLSLYERDYNNKIPVNSYLVLGDEIYNSTDSRSFGLIDKKNIIGKVVLNKK